jgi:stage V sporulation protein R
LKSQTTYGQSLKDYLEGLMSDWSFKLLEEYDDKICEIAKDKNLEWFDINYEVCNYYDMIGHMSYHGMPSHYPHWSFGKSFERTHQMYNLGAEGLPYELIINSDPSIAYLMRENPAYLQILIMAHCVGHSDFFKNNRTFKNTRPESVNSRFRSARKRIQDYIESPHIGLKKVENFIDAIHSIKFQTERHERKRISTKKKLEDKIRILNSNAKTGKVAEKDITKIIIDSRKDSDLLSFLIESNDKFEDWQTDIMSIVRDESHYFIPQIKTKILNEGWASFWHYNIMKNLNLPQEYHIPFLKSHNQVIRPQIGAINPYHLGFYLFEKIEKEMGIEECFRIREIHDDVSAIRFYLDINDYRKLNLFSYSKKSDKITIDDISDEDGWKLVRNSLLKNIGIDSIPKIYVEDITKGGTLILNHEHDGRDLDLEYADNVIGNIRTIWPGDVKFFTVIEEESWEI